MSKMKIRIIGGGSVDIPGGIDILQAPSSVQGLSRHPDLYEADFIVFTDSKTCADFPKTINELNDLGRGFPPEINDKLIAHGKEFLPKQGNKRVSYDQNMLSYSSVAIKFIDENGKLSIQDAINHGMEFCEAYKQALAHILTSCIVAAKAGAVVVFLISDNPDEATITKFLIPNLVIEPASDSKILPFRDSSEHPNSFFSAFQSGHISLVKKSWIFDIGIKSALQTRQTGDYPISDIIPVVDSEDKIRFYPGACNTKGAAKSLVMEYGKGGIVIMPSVNLDDLVSLALKAYNPDAQAAVPEVDERLCSVKETAKLLGISTRQVHRMAQTGTLSKIKLSERKTGFSYRQVMRLVSGK